MNKWKLSTGTACVVGLKQCNAEVLPTTAYVMLGEKCANACQFCAQSSMNQSSPNRLSRITWLEYDGLKAAQAIDNAYRQRKVKRACLQVVRTNDCGGRTLAAIDILRSLSDMPLSVASHLDSVDQVMELARRGASKVCIALDAATPELFYTVKGGDWQKRWQLLTECAALLPGQIVTHLIVGLGESEQQMIRQIAACQARNIEVALFAFTPIRGTRMAGNAPPDIGHYRRIQVAAYLLKSGYSESTFSYTHGKLSAININPALLNDLLNSGEAFRVSGCLDCNRPYYNESPGKVMYNYPRPLSPAEIVKALDECQLWEEGKYGLALDY